MSTGTQYMSQSNGQIAVKYTELIHALQRMNPTAWTSLKSQPFSTNVTFVHKISINVKGRLRLT